MEKSNDYDKIHNEVVQSEQVGDVFLCRLCMHYVQEFLVTQYTLRDCCWSVLVFDVLLPITCLPSV